MAMPGTETIRFRRPTSGPNAVSVPSSKPEKDEFGASIPTGWKRRHQGLLQDKVGRQARGPIIPSFSLAVRLLLLMRTAGAMYSIISDCDEVFNFFEPLHYFQYNTGFQTWELSPEFAIRSWTYLLLHWPLAQLGPKLLGLGKRQAFFALRISLGGISSLCEAFFYRAVVEAVNERVGRYLLFAMLFSAGMWAASTGASPFLVILRPVKAKQTLIKAFLPSTFTMYTTMLACGWWFPPATSTPTGVSRAYRATAAFAAGAIVGWPFSAVLGVPFVLEQLFTTGGEIAVGGARSALTTKRWTTMGKAVALGALIAVPVYLVDAWAYGRPTFPTFNIVLYNLFSGHGPDLYGTSPPTFYFANLFLNFNFLLLLALISLPSLVVTYIYDHRRLGKTQQKPAPGETSPYTLLATRLAPFYLWLVVMSAQPHKEERFMFPVYPLLCFNAAVTVYLAKGWLETAYIAYTKSPYRAGKTSLFSTLSLALILTPSILSILRIIAIFQFYHAPFDLLFHFQYSTVPRLLSDAGFAPLPPPKNYVPRTGEVLTPEWDLVHLKVLEPKVTLCYGTEWYRYPSSYLIPEGVDVRFIQTDFDGMMPRPWEPSGPEGAWPRADTRVERAGRFNGANKASPEPGFVPANQCTYLVASHFPSQAPTKLESDYTQDPRFDVEYCTTFLDGASSPWWSRLIWLPGGVLDDHRVYGKYCLMRRK